MATAPVQFIYATGIVGAVLPGVSARLHGSWDAAGRYSEQWSSVDMVREAPATNSVSFRATVRLDTAEHGKEFRWGVSFIDPNGHETWAVPTEVKDRASRERYRSFLFLGASQEEQYSLAHCTRLGANKVHRADGSAGIRFAVWAPNARSVELVFGTIWDRKDPDRTPASVSLPFGDIAGGYIADDGAGIHPKLGPFAMTRTADGVWATDPDEQLLRDFAALDHKPYMFRITRNDGSVAYRTDLYSRCQIGYGTFDPKGAFYTGLVSDLTGTVSCSAVVDPTRVTQYFMEEPPWLTQPPGVARVWPERHFVPDTEFWQDEFTSAGRPPRRVEDLVIYELHTGALGFGSPRPGTLKDAIALLDTLVKLGVNAVELLPMSEFGGRGENWGYSTSHFCAIEYSGGGRDQYKFFVKEAHKRGLAVIMDVVYNHYAHEAGRAQWFYDSAWPDLNCYYWYEGTPFQYKEPDGGYVDNMSTAFAPRYHEEMVRTLFISSAVALVQEFHVDGLRVDQTTSIHGYNVRHADGVPVPDANIFGAKLLRELGRTLRLIKPEIIMMAEDHSTWDEVTKPVEDGGMGFDARWYADFCHHLAGDTDKGPDYAKLVWGASQQMNGEPLHIDYFAGALAASGDKHVVYQDSHDEAGNSKGPLRDPDWDPRDQDKEFTSHRSIAVAAGGAPLLGATRWYAEARCRFAYGITALSAGTPMFLFGEEAAAEKRFKYDAVLKNRENIEALGETTGANLFRFYGDVNRLRLASPALRSRNIAVIYASNENRVLAFCRWTGQEVYLVVASLNDRNFDQGYVISDWRVGGRWKEILNSDSVHYGGGNFGNAGGIVTGHEGSLNLRIPAAGVVVLKLQ